MLPFKILIPVIILIVLPLSFWQPNVLNNIRQAATSVVIPPTPAAKPAPVSTPTPTLTPTPSPTPRPLPTWTPTPKAIKPTQAPPVAINTAPPGAGHERRSVVTNVGAFNVDVIGADLGSTRVIVDTASDSTCTNNCPVLPLATYAARNGAYAAVNGSFFCPDTYPQCAGKTNSFDTLLMNKNKVYFNSDNNVYSVVPAVIFSSGSIRFVGRSLEWGRDTSPDSVIANYPLLISGGQDIYSGSGDPKFTNKGTRDFVANKGNMVYIGTIWGATMDDAAKVLKAMGMDNALNLDEGGSTALWYGGSYLAGPGRNLPNAVLFVRK